MFPILYMETAVYVAHMETAVYVIVRVPFFFLNPLNSNILYTGKYGYYRKYVAGELVGEKAMNRFAVISLRHIDYCSIS